MAPQLAAAIRELTCRTCAGTGELTSRELIEMGRGEALRLVTGCNCPRCQGTGISHYDPKLPA